MVNRLAAETSPYLRQHADNPVDWYPWGDEAFARARAEDRPVLLSVGYSSCHWCHVMAHESFEDEETAAALNASFVAVKVDREERPDIDAVYMEAVQAMTGRGGWPMTVFLTPDGRPFFAGTYFPPGDAHGTPGFGRVLDAIDEAWRQRRSEIETQADSLLSAIDRRVTMPADLLAAGGDALDPGSRYPDLLATATAELAGRFDATGGGFGPAPKFPQPALLELCLAHARLTGDAGSSAMVDTTLAAMAAGGLYDHLGGGFARYSVDATWTVPHFEKMLYDQAGLVRIYLHAALATGDDRWHQVVEETVGYVLRDLAAPDGGLYAAEDADSEGVEGRFYVWTPEEVAAVAGDLSGPALAWYGVTAGGNFEGHSILRRPVGAPLRRPPDVEEARRRLFEARRLRVRPGLDDKVLTEWNAMFCSALAEAAGATGRPDWTAAAVGIAEFLVTRLRRAGDGRWMRSWQGGEARHLGYAGDYAWVVDCLTRVGELTGQTRWLEVAADTAGQLLALFTSDDGPLFTTGTDAESLVVRPSELLDGATPSASAVAAGALFRLGALTGDHDLVAAGDKLLSTLVPVAATHPLAVAHAIATCQLAGGGITEVVVTGARPDLVGAVRRRFEPTVVLASGEPTGSPLWAQRIDGFAYVCRHYACRAPAAGVDELEAHLDRELAADRARHTAAVEQARLRAGGPVMTRTEAEADAGRRRRKSAPKHGRRRTPTRAPGTHRCMVLACGVEDTVGVDLTNGALVRLRIDWSDEREADLAPFDVIDAAWAADPERDDLAQPEAVTVAGLPERVGTLRGRQARRVVRHLVAPEEPHLLGFPGPSAPYWEFHGMRPSVALVVPRRGPLLFRRRADGGVWARFSAARSDNWLPVEDRRAMAALWATRQDRLSGKGLSAALGFRPHFVVVAVSRPRDGHCYKTVAAILPRP